MTPYYQKNDITIYHGDLREVLPQLSPASVDHVVTDPPYLLNFMGKEWDSADDEFHHLWAKECLRLVKPGGLLM